MIYYGRSRLRKAKVCHGIIWGPLASALGARDYSDDDIRWVLSEAGAFILEGTEQGRSVYRLYHQALADVMRKGIEIAEVDKSSHACCGIRVPHRAGSSLPDWLIASPYIRSHLSAHASRCGMLETLLSDPLFLLAAEPVSLFRAISTHPIRKLQAIETVYRGVVHHLREESVEVSAWYFELAARSGTSWISPKRFPRYRLTGRGGPHGLSGGLGPQVVLSEQGRMLSAI